MKKSIGQVFLALGFVTMTFSGCAAAPTPVPSVITPSSIPPALTPGPTSTSRPSLSVTRTSISSGPITTVGAFFALSVPDVQASANWYSEKFGLKIVMQPPKADQSTVIVLEGGGLIVELIQHDNALSLKAAAPSIADPLLIYGIAKAGAIVDDFEGMVAMLKERNVPIAFGPFPATADQRANVIIRDNAGNMIQFFGK